jgi:hypothetical protein
MVERAILGRLATYKSTPAPRVEPLYRFGSGTFLIGLGLNGAGGALG